MKIIQILGLGAALAFQLTSAHYLSDEQIMEEFTPYDLDKDSHISAKEMDTATRAQLKQFQDPYVSQQEMTQFVNDIVNSLMVHDVDKDEKLNFQEFADMMRKEHGNHEEAGQQQNGGSDSEASKQDIEVVNDESNSGGQVSEGVKVAQL